MKERTLIMIVTFNPDLIMLEHNVRLLKKQFQHILIIDNGSKNITDLLAIFKNDVFYILNHINQGLSKALNSGFMYGSNNNFDIIITFDQDSSIPENFSSEYFTFFTKDSNVILSPSIYDRSLPIKKKYELKAEKIENAIISGLMMSINTWEKIGKFDENLFIDGIDHEFILRAKLQGINVYRLNNVSLSHEIGKGKEFNLIFYHIKVYNHNAFRKYHIAYSINYIAKKHGNIFDKIYARIRILKQLILVTLFESNKYNKLKNIIRGARDGKKS